MLNSLKRFARHSFVRVPHEAQMDRVALLGGQIRAEQILARGKLGSLSEAGFGVFSQYDEDGILSWLIDRIAPKNNTFVELCARDYRVSSTRYIANTRAWSGLVVDANPNNLESICNCKEYRMCGIKALCAFINRDNIEELIKMTGLTDRIGVLSVDINSIDYWILEGIGSYADIIVIGYNNFFGDAPVSVPYDPGFGRWLQSPHRNYWGASLSAFRYLLEARSYKFAGTNLIGIKAFFVHGDLSGMLDNYLESIVVRPCMTCDAREAKEKLASNSRVAFRAEVGPLPLIRVDTGEAVTYADVYPQ